ncbi:hypothetical protein N1031_19700 [Herbiconiux moechotypicola]|nr:hypothetical protein [Herbiconiux moechotypicola]MCS5731986.1 hypothetical protein [Herbiconiux moechotypicola]
MTLSAEHTESNAPSRRAVLTAAWTVPVVALAAAAPHAAASGDTRPYVAQTELWWERDNNRGHFEARVSDPPGPEIFAEYITFDDDSISVSNLFYEIDQEFFFFDFGSSAADPPYEFIMYITLPGYQPFQVEVVAIW